MTVFSRKLVMHAARSSGTLEERRQREMANYWRIRLSTAIDHLEREARRMLQLEEDLGAFAMRYHGAVADAMGRFDALNQQLSDGTVPADPLPEWNDVLLQCHARADRRTELVERFRMLTKEIAPDRARAIDSFGGMSSLHRLNAAYQHGDLAALLKLEAELLIAELGEPETCAAPIMEAALGEIKRAAETYGDGYRALLTAPLYTIMLRASAARVAGWDMLEGNRGKVERAIAERERVIFASMAGLGDWQDASETVH